MFLITLVLMRRSIDAVLGGDSRSFQLSSEYPSDSHNEIIPFPRATLSAPRP